jgi:glyoxylase-like metal-dependent hydrolase (beta-lactamase superfamily II)
MNGTLRVKKLGGGVWTFNESVQATGPQVDAYLVVGKERALVIDTLQEERNIYKAVRGITDLPVEVVITHAHGDHLGIGTLDFIEAGCGVYIDKEKEAPLLGASAAVDPAYLKPLREGMTFDLGGCCLEILSVPGHTPGSVVLLDRARQILFTGDAIGAGVFWMQVPSAQPLHVLLGGLDRLSTAVKGMDQLVIHPGHRHQAPVQHTGEYLDDVITATRKILSGEWVGSDAQMTRRGVTTHHKTVSYKLLTDYAYNPGNL